MVVRVATQRRSDLARRNTVYTIDLLGFGRSDRPAIRYSARLYISLISDFVSRVIGCADACSSHARCRARTRSCSRARDPQRFPAVALIAPSGLVRLNKPASIGERGEPAGGRHADSRHRDVQRARRPRPTFAATSSNTYSDDTLVTASWWRFTTPRRTSAVLATLPAAFMSGHLNIDVRHALRRLSQPALLVWGEHGSAAPVEEYRGFRALKRDIEIIRSLSRRRPSARSSGQMTLMLSYQHG